MFVRTMSLVLMLMSWINLLAGSVTAAANGKVESTNDHIVTFNEGSDIPVQDSAKQD